MRFQQLYKLCMETNCNGPMRILYKVKGTVCGGAKYSCREQFVLCCRTYIFHMLRGRTAISTSLLMIHKMMHMYVCCSYAYRAA